ncbi:MAG: Glyceraldehyde-3-phosphate dehydrogenase [Planctomycetes bacterium ADurb.Bin126]|nr:MAG: Glyceraldehyde-3-phosphate dehydrogenase [Planctomycetes bacterium ADurb.Bin126]HOD80803.1 type I glyceraldehyde-3-phosphate dehydrogenase [Phycisphaerae bacterium]HQL72042.1 type I glyceraldehyde-3-phosphate dehydrogenase [Phycisphaerae bacterium]
MAIKVGINGFGRIGRLTFRKLAENFDKFDVVAINDLFDADMLAYMLRYDSTQGRFPGKVVAKQGAIVVNGKEIPILGEKDPTKLPWGAKGVDVVLESTGKFTSRATEGKGGYDSHLAAGARKVLLSAPAKDKPDATIVLGVNDDLLQASHKCVSNASCTTNSLAPACKVLHESVGIVKGLMTTVHAYTNDQAILDMPYKDKRRGRAAAINTVPSTTGAAKALGEVFPALKGKLHGYALRVPVPTGSITDLTFNAARKTSVEEINETVRAAAEGPMKGIIEFVTDPIVSSDIIGNPASSIFDSTNTIVLDGDMVKVTMWYDNEWGYSCRSVDLIERLAAM